MKRIPRKSLQEYTNEYKVLIANMEPSPDKQLIQDNEHFIVSSFQTYEDNILQLESLSTSSIHNQRLKDILVNKFETADSFKDKIRREFASRKCPYCWYNSLEESVPVEHYIPKSKFQEYSLLGLNLFLCCKRCNSRKWSWWVTWTRDTLNPYIDDLYDRDFLKVNIRISRNRIIVEVMLDFSSCISTQEKELLQRHFEKFKLIPRIKNFINTDIVKLIEIAYQHEQIRPWFKIDSYLLDRYYELLISDGKNSILTVVYKYFIDNPHMFIELFDYHLSTKT